MGFCMILRDKGVDGEGLVVREAKKAILRTSAYHCNRGIRIFVGRQCGLISMFPWISHQRT